MLTPHMHVGELKGRVPMSSGGLSFVFWFELHKNSDQGVRGKLQTAEGDKQLFSLSLKSPLKCSCEKYFTHPSSDGRP